MPSYPDYFGQAALPPQPDIPRTLDQVADIYFKKRTLDEIGRRQQQEAAQQRLDQGFSMSEATPEAVQLARGPENMVESPAIAAMRDYIKRKQGDRDLSKRKTEAEIGKLQSASTLHPIEEGSPFYTNPDTGMMFRIKPGHKGPEYIPLPGQAIGPDGRVVFTADRAEEGKMLPPGQVLALNEGKNVARLLPEVESAIKENESIFGPFAGRVGQANPYDERAQSVDARMRTASQSFGRFMEGGVLRKEDEEKYRKMFPQLNDTPPVAKKKLAIVRRQLAQKYEDDRKTLGASKYDISGFEPLQIPSPIFGPDENQPAAQESAPLKEGEESVELLGPDNKPRRAVYRGDKFLRWQ